MDGDLIEQGPSNSPPKPASTERPPTTWADVRELEALVGPIESGTHDTYTGQRLKDVEAEYRNGLMLALYELQANTGYTDEMKFNDTTGKPIPQVAWNETTDVTGQPTRVPDYISVQQRVAALKAILKENLKNRGVLLTPKKDALGNPVPLLVEHAMVEPNLDRISTRAMILALTYAGAGNPRSRKILDLQKELYTRLAQASAQPLPEPK